MNRRTVLQVLGIAPLAVLPTGQAPAEEGAVYEVRDEAFNSLVGDAASWKRSKLFSVTAALYDPISFNQLTKYMGARTGTVEPIKPFEDMATAIRESTKTPDIMMPATISVFGRDARLWYSRDEDVSRLFRRGQHRLAWAIFCAVRAQLSPGVGLWKVVDGVIEPVGDLPSEQATLDQIDEVLRQLGMIQVRFHFYGPTPKPLSRLVGRII